MCVGCAIMLCALASVNDSCFPRALRSHTLAGFAASKGGHGHAVTHLDVVGCKRRGRRHRIVTAGNLRCLLPMWHLLPTWGHHWCDAASHIGHGTSWCTCQQLGKHRYVRRCRARTVQGTPDDRDRRLTSRSTRSKNKSDRFTYAGQAVMCRAKAWGGAGHSHLRCSRGTLRTKATSQGTPPPSPQSPNSFNWTAPT